MHSGREQTVRDSCSYVAYWVIKCSLAFAIQTQWCLPWFISKSILPFSSVFMLTSQRADHAEPQHQMMINIATDTHLCIYLISMSVDSFWLITFTDIIFFFSLGNWRRKCLFPWQQQLKHQPLSVVRWWEFSSSRHRHSHVYIGETSHNTSEVMTGEASLLPLWATATGP